MIFTPPTEHWSQTRVGSQETFDGIWLRATASDDTVRRIEVTKQALLEDTARRPAVPGRSPALVSGNSLAYLIAKRDEEDPEGRSQLGTVGYGPDGATLAHNLNTHITTWGTARTASPHMTIQPTGTPDSALPEGHAIDKVDSPLVLTSPSTRAIAPHVLSGRSLRAFSGRVAP